jgi:prepilin signal peptidase PulO-like enzyme (type II secretory pathway)
VLVFMGVAFYVTYAFHANVDAQGGAYATGVLVLITSAACAVTLSVRTVSARLTSLLVTLIFVYTTGMNIWERPEGLKISCMFIATIMFVSFVSRATRSTELRITGVEFSEEAASFIREAGDEPIRIIAHRPKATSPEDFDQIEALVREIQGLPQHAPVLFLQVERTDASEFNQRLSVQGVRVGRHCLLHARSPMVSNSIAAILIQIGKVTGQVPHIYFKWREGNPVINIFRFLFLGEGDAAPLTHEVLRKAAKNIERRPIVHVS